MATAPPSVPVPIFVSARGESGRTRHILLEHVELLTDVDADRDSGPYYCQARAPNGREAEGLVDRLGYAQVRGLFRKQPDLALAVDRGDVAAAGARRLRGVGLRLWSGGEPLEALENQVALVSAPHGTAHLQIEASKAAPVDHVQVWSEPGAVTVTVWPAGGSLFPMPGSSDARRRVRPVVLGRDIRCSAYWGFYRHSVIEAVRALGSEILSRAASDAGLSDHELIVASHYAMHFVRPSADLLAPLAAALRRRSDGDSLILLWSIAFDGLLDLPASERRKLFEDALLSLAGGGCLYTEVFRMLVQRLGDAESQWRHELPKDDPPPSHVEHAIRWAKQLASAAYWDTEHLTYSALDPKFPDAHATDAQLGSGAKKKFAVISTL